MEIKRLIVGMVQTNCYIVMNMDTKEAVVVDPGDSAPAIVRAVKEKGADVKAILLTHGHYDHVLAAEELKKSLNAPIYCHEEEAQILADPNLNLSFKLMGPAVRMKADRLLKDGETFEMAGFNFRVIHTPGHTCGSCCYYVEEKKVLFAGDTLFEGSYGRIDFPTGSGRQMVYSVAKTLFDLPDEVEVFPGHMGFTTIGDEKRYNPLAGYRGKI